MAQLVFVRFPAYVMKAKKLIEATITAAFYVGRSVDLDRRKGEHGDRFNRYVVLMANLTLDEALDIETNLHRYFGSHQKNVAAAADARGDVPDVGGTHCVYIALLEREATRTAEPGQAFR